jgi:hypothetical protein
MDVLGLDVDAAIAALGADGYRVEIVETRTPKAVTLTGARRVVRQRAAAAGLVQLVVTHERFGPRPEGAPVEGARPVGEGG